MKKILLIAFPLLMMTVTSCDFVRKIVGKPTSAEIEAKKQELIRQEAERRAAVEQARRDSIALAEVMMEENKLRAMGIDSVADGVKLDRKYYVIVGSFKKQVFADEMVAMTKKAGYEPVAIAMSNGFTMISAYATDSLWEARRKMAEIEHEDFCPMDVWIMVANE